MSFKLLMFSNNYIIFSAFCAMVLLFISGCDKKETGFVDKVELSQGQCGNVAINHSMERGVLFCSNIIKSKKAVVGLPDGWTTGKQLLNSSSGWAANESHSGTRSLKIVNLKGNDAYWQGQAITCRSGVNGFSASIWTKMEKISKDSLRLYCTFNVYLKQAGGQIDKFIVCMDIPRRRSEEWGETSKTFYFAEDIVKIIPQCRFAGVGIVYFDDLSIRPLKIDKQKSGNLLSNGGFELRNNMGGPLGWSTSHQELNNSSGYIKNVAHSGKYSIKIVNRNMSPAKWEGRFIELPAGVHNVLLSGWSKSEDVGQQGLYCLNFYIIHKDGSGKFFYPQSLSFSRKSKWEFRNAVYASDKEIKKIKPICLFQGATGTVWFDDISIRVLNSGT
jgi:hypothetical protein